MRAVPASILGLERLAALWNLAYAGYFVPLSWDVAQLCRHVDGGSIDLDRSLVWLDGVDPIALSLLGVRPAPQQSAPSAHSTERGADPIRSSVQDLREWPTSSVQNQWHPESSAQDPPLEKGERGWIGGFGIAPSHRGRGLAVGLMREQLDVARDSGVRHVQLEVLTQNWAARSYERAGFVTTRRLLVLQGMLERNVCWAGAEASRGLWLDARDVPDLAGQLRRLHRAHPAAWTREPQSVLRDLDGLRCLAVGSAHASDALDAALLLREHAGVLQVADAAALDAAAAEVLVAAIESEYPGRELRVVNEPEGSPLAGAFARVGLAEVMAQHEMHWSA